MGYFSYLTEQSFKTDEDGRRVFYQGGPWSRPYLVPDSETEMMLKRRQTFLLRYTFGPFIVGQSILFAFWPATNFPPTVFLGYLVAVMALFGLAGWLAHRRLVSGLQRVERRLSLRRFYQSMADRHSTGGLALGLIASVLFVAGGYWMINWQSFSGTGSRHLIGWICMILFSPCAVAWGYALTLKLRAK